MKLPADGAIQDHYPDDVAHCYGCGRLNDAGHRVRTGADGEETVTWFTPDTSHTAIPGFVYGGLIASLIDCHSSGSAAIAAERAAGRAVGDRVAPRFVTASLKVDYLEPTPLGPELELRGRVKEMRGRKVVIETTLSADGTVTARGEAVLVLMPEAMLKDRA
jgi:acyl-coenzyme A thioesterase PaaI-like protein